MSSPSPPGGDGPALGSGDDAGGSTRLVRSSVAVALGTALSRLTGLGRVALLAYAIGRGTLADTYSLANTTPNIVYELILGGVLSATLVPLFVEHVRRHDERATSALVTVSMTVLVALTAVAVALAPLIARLYTFRGADQHVQQQVATTLIRLFLPQMVFYGITALATALLNARRRFVAAAFAPVLNNLVVISMILTFVRVTEGSRSRWVDVASVRGDTGLLLLLGLGTTAGIAAMALVLVPALVRAGVHLRPVFDWGHQAVRTMLRLSGWTVGYVVANQLALSVVLVLANGVQGGVAAYQYAFIFFQLPHGLFAVSIMTTVTPELARYATDRDLGGMRTQYAQGLRYLVLVVLPAAVAYLVLAQTLVGVMQTGAFGASDVTVTADTLQALALGLLPFSVYLYTLRGFYALQDTRTPFLVNCFENGVNVVLALALFGPLGVQGLALAYAGAYSVASLVALALLRRRLGGLAGRPVAVAGARALVAAGVLALVAAPVAGILDPQGPAAAATTVAVAAGLGGIAYLLVLRALGVGDLAELWAAIVRRRARGPRV